VIFIKRRHLVAVQPRGAIPDQVSHPLAALPTIKSPRLLCLLLSRLSFCRVVTRGFLDHPTILARPQLPHSSPFSLCPNHLASNLMSDFRPTSIPTDCARHCCHSPTLRSRLPRQQLDSDADRAIEYLALQARWLPAHVLALDPYTRPCLSFSPHRTSAVAY
jgi:hypothetical protein